MADDDDLLDEVMRQLSGALGDFDAEALRSSVRDGLREALSALQPEPAPRPDGRPNVVVLEGGLSEGGDEAQIDEDDDELGSQAAAVSVQLVRSTEEGWLAPKGDWQTVFAGVTAAPYRLACVQGELEVAADDRTVATLLTGQSCDVEAATVRVRGVGSGSYRRLTPTR